jgi:hypothetical protein
MINLLNPWLPTGNTFSPNHRAQTFRYINFSVSVKSIFNLKPDFFCPTKDLETAAVGYY